MCEESHNPYLDGDWLEARDNLSELLDLLIWPGDVQIAEVEEELMGGLDEIEHEVGVDFVENDRL